MSNPELRIGLVCVEVGDSDGDGDGERDEKTVLIGFTVVGAVGLLVV